MLNKVGKEQPAPRGAKDAGPRKALGRGLASLMSGPSASATTGGGVGFRMLPMERVTPNKSQPRKMFDPEAIRELADSIRVQGVLQPIIVRRSGEDYEIVAGERRWRAATQAGLREIPAMIKELTDTATLQIALIENIQRRDLDPLEESEAYYRLIQEHRLTHDELAEAVGKNRVTITNSLRLLKLPDGVLKILSAGDITAGHARALLAAPTPSQALRLAEDVVGRKLSVRDTEARAKQLQRAAQEKRVGGRSGTAKAESSRSPGVTDIEERLQRHLGTKVRLITTRTGAGHIEVNFHSSEALDDLLDRMMGH
jgi:ParB family chromosome partitioning protein